MCLAVHIYLRVPVPDTNRGITCPEQNIRVHSSGGSIDALRSGVTGGLEHASRRYPLIGQKCLIT